MSPPASLPYVSRAELEQLLPFGDAVDELRAAFSETRADAPQRTRLDVPAGELLLMPAFGSEGVGVKLVTVHAAEPPPPRGRCAADRVRRHRRAKPATRPDPRRPRPGVGLVRGADVG